MERPATVDALLAVLREQTAECRSLAASLESDQLLARPTHSQWSVAEHIAHLTLMNRHYGRVLGAAVASAGARGMTGGSHRGTIVGRFVLSMVEPPPKMRVKTFKPVTPARDLDPRQVLDDFEAAQGLVEAALESARGVDIGRARMWFPFISFLRMAVVECFQFVPAHNARHLWHIREILPQLAPRAAASGQ